MKNKGFKKLSFFLILVVLIFLLNRHFNWTGYLKGEESLLFLKETANNNLVPALIIYVLLTIIGCVVLALPGVTFALISGVLFGPILGTLSCLFATTLGAMAAFLASRFFLKDAVKPYLEKNKVLKNLLFSGDVKKDFIILMITRLLPIFPYNLQNFAYGITDISFFKYSLYTFIFMFPGVAFFTIGASGLTAGEERYKYFIIAGVLALAVTLFSLFLKKKFLGKEGEKA